MCVCVCECVCELLISYIEDVESANQSHKG